MYERKLYRPIIINVNMLIYTNWISKLYKILATTLTLTYEGDDLLLKDELNAINSSKICN